MTPQERQLIDDLFSRLEKLESAPRDSEAETAIVQGLRRAPNATYALVQTALLQDEALKRAGMRIEELEAQLQPASPSPSPNQGSFLDSLRGSLFGGSAASARGSVPNVPPSSGAVWNNNAAPPPPYGDPRYQTAPGYGGPQPQQSGGPSFLGTAAAAAAGVIGGSMLMNSIRGLGSGFGGMGGGQGFSDTVVINEGNRNPWGGNDGSNSLSRDAGLNDIGKNNDDRRGDDRQNFADQSQNDDNYASSDNDDDSDFGSDDYGSGDSDYA